MTISEYMSNLEIEASSFSTDVACESIMFNLYAPTESEYAAEDTDYAAESLSLTFDDMEEDFAATPAFEEAKEGFFSKIKTGLGKVAEFFVNIAKAIGQFIAGLFNRSKNKKDDTAAPAETNSDAGTSEPTASASTTASSAAPGGNAKPSNSAPSQNERLALTTDEKRVPTLSEIPAKKESSFKPKENKTTNTPAVIALPDTKKEETRNVMGDSTYEPVKRLSKELIAQITSTYKNLVSGFTAVSNTEAKLQELFKKLMDTVPKGFKSKKNIGAISAKERKPFLEDSLKSARINENSVLKKADAEGNSFVSTADNLVKFAETQKQRVLGYVDKTLAVFDNFANLKASPAIKKEIMIRCGAVAKINPKDVIAQAQAMKSRCEQLAKETNDLQGRSTTVSRERTESGTVLTFHETTLSKIFANYSKVASIIVTVCSKYITVMGKWAGICM